jgi:predicted ribonuclease YlaK
LQGSAGTGKTLLTIAAGLTQVLDLKRYNEIIMTRVTIPVGEDIGFLPGTEEEKMTPWMGALMDNLSKLLRVVASVDTLDFPHVEAVSQHTGIPVSTVKRYIAVARSDLKMEISYVQRRSKAGEKGFYMISEWGVLERHRTVIEYGLPV